jgi:hypothetical protein
LPCRLVDRQFRTKLCKELCTELWKNLCTELCMELFAECGNGCLPTVVVVVLVGRFRVGGQLTTSVGSGSRRLDVGGVLCLSLVSGDEQIKPTE